LRTPLEVAKKSVEELTMTKMEASTRIRLSLPEKPYKRIKRMAMENVSDAVFT
jgi:hypothetical protein